MTKLSVNVNKIAVLRNSRGGSDPNVFSLAELCIRNGVDGITVHPRNDLRHIKPIDVKQLRQLTLKYAIEFNIEGNPFSEKSKDYPGFLSLVQKNKPEQCTLVPDDPSQLTSDHGWNLQKVDKDLFNIISSLKSQGIRVSLFLDPDPKQVTRAKELGADRVELYTGPYAHSYLNKNKREKSLNKYKKAVDHAISVGLEVNAGHDLNLENLKTFLKIGNIKEVSIGHALISDSLLYGLEKTVKLYLNECK